ncbi:MAG: hypothetical protein IKO68_13665 [Oscillospiraceae bacterium]|nr:hypothetical protein [Oscillospiraceae bacterium]
MRIAKAVAAMIVLSICLTACGRNQERTLYADDNVVVTRSGSLTSVLDAYSGKEYYYTTHRIKRRTADAGAYTAKTLTETDDLFIQSAHGILILTIKDTLKTIVIPAKSH